MGCGDDYFDFASTKVHNLVQVTFLIESHVYECTWFGVAPRTDTKNKHIKKDFGMCPQNMMIIIGSVFNRMGANLYDHLVSTRIFTLIINKLFI